MTKWAARAKAEIVKTGHLPTVRTDETPIPSVSSVPFGAVLEFPAHVSSVSSVGAWAILEIDAIAANLLAAAMTVCDRHGDGEAARDQIRQECLELPPHLQRDLLAHFQGTCCSKPKNNQKKSSYE